MDQITGNDELESLHFDWVTALPGMLSGHKQCNTGTCRTSIKANSKTKIYISEEFDSIDAHSLKQSLGELRKAL